MNLVALIQKTSELYASQAEQVGLSFHLDLPSEALVIRGNGRVGVNTIDPVSKFHVEGTVTTSILQITGGADIAEPFPVIDGQAVAPGAVLVIAPDRPGWLRASAEA